MVFVPIPLHRPRARQAREAKRPIHGAGRGAPDTGHIEFYEKTVRLASPACESDVEIGKVKLSEEVAGRIPPVPQHLGINPRLPHGAR